MLLSTTTIHLQNVHGCGYEQSGADPTKSAVFFYPYSRLCLHKLVFENLTILNHLLSLFHSRMQKSADAEARMLLSGENCTWCMSYNLNYLLIQI